MSDQQSLKTSPRRIRVLLFIQLLELGGSEKQCVEMARLLSRNGYDVTVGCMRKEGPLFARIQEAGIPLVEFPVGSLLRPRAVVQMLRLARFIRKNKFDVVHANDLYADLFAVPAARLAGTPVVISSQRDMSEWAWYTPRRRKILRRVQRLSTWILVNSEAIRSYLVAQDGMDPDRIRVVYNGIDAARFAPAVQASAASGERFIVMVANMHQAVKGHTDLIAAAQSVCRDYPDARFLLIGDGELRPALEARVRELGLYEKISFMGHCKDVPATLSRCEIGVLASRAEGLPNAVLEYMAAGLATVATSVGGVPEIIQHGVNGLLVPAKDPDALAAGISRLLADAPLRQRLARAARETVLAKFDFASLLNSLRSLYQGPRPAPLAIRGRQTIAIE